MRYFQEYSGGIEDVKETLNLFSDIVEKSIIPEIPIPELKRIRAVFPEEPSHLLDEVRTALFEEEDDAKLKSVEDALRKLKEDLSNLADGAQDSLERRLLNVLHMCAEKLAALLAYKRIQIQLARDKGD